MKLAGVKHIKIGDASYPVKLTQRAMIEYEGMTGDGILSFDGTQKMTQLFYCAARAGAKAEGKPFEHTFDEFLDLVDDYPMDILNNFGGGIGELFASSSPATGKK